MIILEQEFLELVRIDRPTLKVWIEEEWLLPKKSAEGWQFSDLDLARANLIIDLRENMGVNDAGLDVILHLLDQMYGLRSIVSELLGSIHESAGTK